MLRALCLAFFLVALLSPTLGSKCSGSHHYFSDHTSGHLACDGYDDDVDITWEISLDDSSLRILLEFSEFDTEYNFDRVYIYDGTSASGLFLGSYSGSEIPGPFYSVTSSMFIEFETDSSVHDYSGFYANWSTFAGEENVVYCDSSFHEHFHDASGHFGCSGYTNSIHPSWHITGDSGERLVIEFETFNTESSYDVVYVYDGPNSDGTLLQSFSGSDLPPPVQLSGNEGYVRFETDSSVSFSGFSASWSSLSQVNDPCFNSTSLVVLGFSGYIGCGSGYGNNLHTSWLLVPVGDYIIQLDFLTINLEDGYDYVNVYDGNSADSRLLGSYTGQDTPRQLVSSSNRLFITLVSDQYVTGDGFTAQFRTARAIQAGGCSTSGTQELTAPDGSIGCDGYADGIEKDWYIQAQDEHQVISLMWESFDCQEGHDFIYVYDGPDANSELLYIGRYAGTAFPENVVSTQQYMTIQFISDSDGITGSGFSAIYESIVPAVDYNSCYVNQEYYLNDQEGEFGCSGYGDNVDITWQLEVESGYIILLSFDYFDTESGYDMISIFDGPTSSSTQLGSWSGSSRPPALSSNSQYLFIRFTSDAAVTAGGFTASYSSVYTGNNAQSCFSNDATVLTAPTGTFGCDGYGSNVAVSWLISSNSNVGVNLKFTSFNTEEGYDFVTVYDGSTTSASVLATYSGPNRPDPVSSSGNQMLVVFTSDDLIARDGFNAAYTTFPLISGIASCSTSYNYYLTEREGEFGCNGYSNNVLDTWTISSDSPNGHILLRFNSYDTESFYDTIKVYDGPSTSATLLVTLSGRSTGPLEFTSSSNSMLVTFASDSSTSEGFVGFVADYETIITSAASCSADASYVLTESTGSFGCNGYENSVRVEWSIQTFGNIILRFSSFDTESYDHLTVYDGASSDSPVLATFSGSALPPTILSNGSAMTVVFTSDSSVTYPGFSASYASVDISFPPVNQVEIEQLFEKL